MRSSLVALCLAACVGFATCTLLQGAIYTQLKGSTTCTRLLDEFGEIGCSTPSAGTVGVLYLVNDSTTLTAFQSATNNDYLVLLPQRLLALSTNGNSTLNTLLSLSHFKGALVYDDGFTQDPTVKFSADSLVPNANTGLPFGLGGRSVVNWNVNGGGYNNHALNFSEGLHWAKDLPIFAYLNTTDQQTVFQCYNQYNQNNINNKDVNYELCAARISSFMFGAENTLVCLRRGYCNALGNLNLYGTTHPLQSTSKVVVVAAQIDSLAFFHDLTFGAEADVSGLVVALAAADLLGDALNNASRSLPNQILFSLFHGESFGYIGSSRFAYDLNNNAFPSTSTNISVNNILAYIELNQVSQQSNYHVYSIANTSIINPILTTLQSFSGSLTFVNETSTSDLPPASLRGILNEFSPSSFPGVVIADHPPTGFTNKFYHSRFDNGDNIGAPSSPTNTSAPVVQQLCNLASSIVQSAWSLANNGNTSLLFKQTANCQLIAELLYCLTRNSSCLLASSIIGSSPSPSQPFSRYVSTVPADVYSSDAATAFIRGVLAQALAINKNVSVSSSVCQLANTASSYTLYPLNSGICLNTSIFAQIALSPAFNDGGTSIKSVRNPRYSTLTESQWDSLSISVFRIESQEQQLEIVLGGLAYFFVTMFLVWFLVRKAQDGQIRRSVPRP